MSITLLLSTMSVGVSTQPPGIFVVEHVGGHRERDLAHDEGGGVDGGSDVARSDLLEAGAGVAVVAEEQQILAAERLRRLRRTHDLVVVGREDHLDLRMRLQHVHGGDVAALDVPLAVEAGDHRRSSSP